MLMRVVLVGLVCESDQGDVFGRLFFFPSIFLCAFVRTILGLQDKIMTVEFALCRGD